VPIIELAKAIADANPGQVLLLIATDPAVEADLLQWSSATRNELLSFQSERGIFRAYVKKAG